MGEGREALRTAGLEAALHFPPTAQARKVELLTEVKTHETHMEKPKALKQLRKEIESGDSAQPGAGDRWGVFQGAEGD